MYLGPHAPFWYWLTRFGELGIVLPLALGVALWLLFAARSSRPATAWLVPLGVAAGVTTASKIAFIGFGLGLPSINFTGFSGHSMFAAAVYPVLAYAIANRRREGGREPSARALRWTAVAVAGGFGLALLIALSRVMIRVHSYSEVVLGFVLGAVASAAALWWLRRTTSHLRARWIGVGVIGWLAVMPIQAAPSRSHDLVTRIALAVSDRDRPYTRADMERDYPRGRPEADARLPSAAPAASPRAALPAAVVTRH